MKVHDIQIRVFSKEFLIDRFCQAVKLLSVSFLKCIDDLLIKKDVVCNRVIMFCDLIEGVGIDLGGDPLFFLYDGLKQEGVMEMAHI